MATALRSSSLRLRSMSSISRSFCKGQQGAGVGAGARGARVWPREPRLPPARLSSRLWPHTWVRLPDAVSYLGDLGEDDGSVLLALSQGLHGGQEFSPLLDFLHHCTGGRALSARAGGPVGRSRSPPGAHILQSGPARGPGPAAPGVPFSSVPLCPSPWQRGLGVSASPSPGLLGGPEVAREGARGAPCTLQGAWAVQAPPLLPWGHLSL